MFSFYDTCIWYCYFLCKIFYFYSELSLWFISAFSKNKHILFVKFLRSAKYFILCSGNWSTSSNDVLWKCSRKPYTRICSKIISFKHNVKSILFETTHFHCILVSECWKNNIKRIFGNNLFKNIMNENGNISNTEEIED